ncbi:MA3 DOMAIN-CONTAINING TRANSLATION REGULATORY FACTOR 1 [Camellia lanceoleosa]|uniref:MA3 DOMAIN-CONTAINING TRANSLATION REGULATORY FACTOR 1 n=1 Tax=Camellia lanceoleosa TaxID=1840588 RepID=A0ACC0HI40_9ERIC|nr:MA3 DOMAIN-CONTAINING TRANSLATION REGULATORY FACTOR 1 [Camellia lanceoleosa]
MLSEHHIKAPASGKATTAGITVKHVRRTHSGKLVRVKKDGAGGKGTWGKLLDIDGESCIDRNDPNYDSGEEPYQLVGVAVCEPLDEYKKAVVSILEEYFSNGDVELAASDLRELRFRRSKCGMKICQLREMYMLGAEHFLLCLMPP